MKKCPIMKQCGACTYGNLHYSEQIEKKQEFVQKLFSRNKVQPVVQMENPYNYRHKIYATFAKDKNKKVIAGTYAERSHFVLKNTDCFIQHQQANDIIQSVCDIANQMHIEPYEEDRRKGVLRHLYIRVSHSTKDVLLVIVIGSKQLPGSKEFVKKILEKHPCIKTIVLNFNDRNTSMVLGDREKVLYGKGYITDNLCGFDFHISPKSFFQVNPIQTEKLYTIAVECAGLKKTDVVLDAYCGIGTISLIASPYVKQVYGVEINKQAVMDAIGNAKLNHVDNVRFECNDAEKYMEKMRGQFDVAFIDPPRSGSTYKFLNTLAHANPKKIVYVSCNPVTQKRDIDILYKKGYRVRKIIPVDQFPFTEHIETIVLLQKLNS